MTSEMIEQINDHVAKANRKHPLDGFKDVGFKAWSGIAKKESRRLAKECIKSVQELNDYYDSKNKIDWECILDEECQEFEYEYKTGNRDRAIEELYDVISVCIRAIHHIGNNGK